MAPSINIFRSHLSRRSSRLSQLIPSFMILVIILVVYFLQLLHSYRFVFIDQPGINLCFVFFFPRIENTVII